LALDLSRSLVGKVVENHGQKRIIIAHVPGQQRPIAMEVVAICRIDGWKRRNDSGLFGQPQPVNPSGFQPRDIAILNDSAAYTIVLVENNIAYAQRTIAIKNPSEWNLVEEQT